MVTVKMDDSTKSSSTPLGKNVRPDILAGVASFFNGPSYREVIESSSQYNNGIVGERKLRLPYLDSQTGVAQSDCFLWMQRTDRMPGVNHGQLYSYPAKRWKKKRRQYLMNDSYLSRKIREAQQNQHHRDSVAGDMNGSFDQEGASTSGLNDSLKTGITGASGSDSRDGVTGNSNNNRDIEAGGHSNDKFYQDNNHSRDAWYGDYDDGTDLPDAGELDDPESDYDDYDTEYGSSSSRKKKKAGGNRKDTPKRKRIEYSDAEKPYACELCGARYKTRPGLSYHYSHSHQNDGNGREGLEEDMSNYGSSTSRGAMTVPSTASSSGSSTPTMMTGTPPTGLPSAGYGGHPPPGSSIPGNYPVPPSVPGVSSIPHGKGSPSSNNTERGASSAGGGSFEGDFGGNRPPGKGSVHAPQNYCDFCLGDSGENKKTNSAEILVSCSDCGRSAHPSCLQFTANMIESVKKYRWQCIECKSCGLCGTSDNDVSTFLFISLFFLTNLSILLQDQLLFCDDCDRGYHMYCLKPPLSEPPEGSWSCHLCIVEYHQDKPLP